MITFRKPTKATIQEWLVRQQDSSLSYSPTGITQSGHVPTGFVRDHYRARLGVGDEVFAKATQLLKQWRQFPSGWLEVFSTTDEPKVGTTVGILVHCPGFWWLNACRVMDVIDEPQGKRRFGFYYGTLASHAECGEEAFQVFQDESGTVWYELTAISHPQHWVVRFLRPVARWYQKRFARNSLTAMVEGAVSRVTCAAQSD